MLTAVLEYKTGFLLLQMHLEELAVAYAERTREGPAREYIERECNTIRATIAHQLQPRMKLTMRPTRRDKLKKMAAAISGTDVRPADLSEAQHRKSRRAGVKEAFEERWKKEWERSSNATQGSLR